MDNLFKHRSGIAFTLCVALIFSVFTFLPNDSVVVAATLSEEAALEKKITKPEKKAEYEGYIVAIKDKAIEKVSDNEVAEEIPSTASDKYYLVETTQEALELASASSIERLEPNYRVYPMDTTYPPNDTHYSNAPVYGGDKYFQQKDTYEFMGIDSLWKAGLDGKGVEVAVIDTGLNKHQDIVDPTNILFSKTDANGYINGNVVEDTIGNDSDGHGTQVTSLIKAERNNGKNIAGVASKADITSIRVFDVNDKGKAVAYNYQVLQAYDYLNINENTPDVINVSLGSGHGNVFEQNVINSLVSKGCIIVAATGNYGYETAPDSGINQINQICYPAGYNGVVGVGATLPKNYWDSNGIADFSSKNSSCDVTAWGTFVPVLSPTDDSTKINNGTSFSSPIVAGIAACLKQANPDLDAESFMDLIKVTSTDMGLTGRDDSYGYGVINAGKMLSYDINYEPNGGTINDLNIIREYYYKKTDIPLPTNVTKSDGSIFKGWYTDIGLTKGPYTAIPAKTYGDLTFYAKWGNTTTVSYDAGSGVSNPTRVTFPIDANYGSLPTLSKEGYTFNGWYKDKSYTQKVSSTNIVGPYDHTLYAKWAINSYNITLYSNGGNAVYKSNVNYGNQIGSLPSPKRSGYTFMGWYTNSELTSKLPDGYIVKGNVTLYAKWLSSNAKLKKIKPSTSKLSKKFKSTKTKYTVTIKKNKGSIKIKATKAVSGQKIRMKIGSGKYKTTNSIKVKLKKGKKKVVTIKVTAPNGTTTKTYKVTVKRKK